MDGNWEVKIILTDPKEMPDTGFDVSLYFGIPTYTLHFFFNFLLGFWGTIISTYTVIKKDAIHLTAMYFISLAK